MQRSNGGCRLLVGAIFKYKQPQPYRQEIDDDELKAAYHARTAFPGGHDGCRRMLRLHEVGALLPGYLADFFIAPAQDDPYVGLIELQREAIEAAYRVSRVGTAPPGDRKHPTISR